MKDLHAYRIDGKITKEVLDKLVEAMRADGLDEELIARTLKNQVMPKVVEQEENSPDVYSTQVCTHPNAKGYEVECHWCGKKAKSPKPAPEGMIATCPDCLMKRIENEEP